MDCNDDDFKLRQPIEEGDEYLCRAVWLAVIVQALLDATGEPRNEWDKLEARRWLEGRHCNTSDFAAVCDLAGIDFRKAGRFVAKVLEGKLDCIDFRCTKKAHLRNRNQESRKRYLRRADKNAKQRRDRLLNTSVSAETCSNDNVPEADNDNFINHSKKEKKQ